MSIKLTVDGIQFEASSPAEAAALYRELRLNNAGKTKHDVDGGHSEQQRTNAKSSASDPANGSDLKVPEWANATAFNLLTAIKDAGSDGLDSSGVMRALRVEKPKAIGMRVAIVNRVLTNMGYAHKRVYGNTRTPTGRYWMGKKALPDALDAIRKAGQL